MDKETNKRIGRLLKEYRLVHGYTLQYIADKIGISRQAICQFECGRNTSVKIILWMINQNILRKEDDNSGKNEK